MARSNEPAFWSLFSAGGMVAAFLIPAAILITAYMVPAGKIDAEQLRDVMDHFIARLLLLAMISLPLFHWAHRFRFALVDLGIKGCKLPIAILFYGTAAGSTICAAYLLLTPIFS